VWCEKPSNCQLEYTQHGGLTCKSTDAETGAVTAGLLGATSRPPMCGVYQGGLSPPLHGMSLGLLSYYGAPASGAARRGPARTIEG
jgi:hypothetical protein